MEMSRRRLKLIALAPVYRVVDAFVRPARSIAKRTLLLIRIDGIGDYVLFRNFIEILRTSERFRNYRITLLGNIAWKDLSLELDSPYVDKFIWIDTRRFENNPYYRWHQLRQITSVGYEVVVSPVHSRVFYSVDWIVRSIRATEKIGSMGDLSNISPMQKRVSDRWYTSLIPAAREVVFEFYRNRRFIEQLLEVRLSVRKPHIEPPGASALPLPTNYAVLFLGGSEPWKKWPIQKFAQVARLLRDQFGINVVLAGGAADVADAQELFLLYDAPMCNLVGSTTLVELLGVVAGSRLLISNDTSAPHLAVALGTPVIVLYNGNHCGRFVPYPADAGARYRPVYHPTILRDFEAYKQRSNTLAGVHDLNSDEISVQSVEAEITDLLSSPSMR